MGALSISHTGMAEGRALKLCTKGNYIKSGQRDDKSSLKGRGFAHVTHFCMQNCRLINNSSRHSVTAISNVVHDGLLLIARTALEATHAKA